MEPISEFNKPSTLVVTNFLQTRAIFGSVIRRPNNNSLLMCISDWIEFGTDSLNKTKLEE